MDDDFEINTAPLLENEGEKVVKRKKTKLNLNKVYKKHDLVSKEKCQLKPKWSDEMYPSQVGEVYDFLNINKIMENEKQNTVGINRSISAFRQEKILNSGKLDFTPRPYANMDYRASDMISMIEFHPTKHCLITASRDGTVCTFTIDNEGNSSAVSKPILISGFPINGGSLIGGERVVLACNRRFYFKQVFLSSQTVLDNTSEETMRVTHHRVDRSACVQRIKVAPGNRWVVVATADTRLFILDAVSMDTSYTTRVSAGPIASLTFSHGGRYMYVFHGQSTVSVFEFQQNGAVVFVRRWIDEGCVEPLRITVSPDNEYIACGSPAVVNVYTLNSVWQSESPVPCKSLYYPESRINQLLFNNSSELLAIGFSLAGDRKHGAIRMLHLKSMTVFSNFPGPKPPNTRPTCFSFSKNGRFFAVGQTDGRVSLFDLHYYDKY